MYVYIYIYISLSKSPDNPETQKIAHCFLYFTVFFHNKGLVYYCMVLHYKYIQVTYT